MVSPRVRAGLAALVLTLCAASASAQTTPELTGNAGGLKISLSWTAVPQALGYNLVFRLNGGAINTVPVGNITSLAIDVPPGVYDIAVGATAGTIQGNLSNVVTLNVSATPPPPPAPPTNLSAAISGGDILLKWNLPPDQLLGVLVSAGQSPGGADLSVPVRVSSSTFVPGVQAGTYYVRVQSIGAGGLSVPSNEIEIALPNCVAPASIALTNNTAGNLLNVEWDQVPGATGYVLEASSQLGGAPDLGTFPFPANVTNFRSFAIPQGTYYLTIRAATCGQTISSPQVEVKVTAPVRLPAKGFGLVQAMVREASIAVAASNRGDLINSCREHRGNNNFMFRVLQRLRAQDNRFGLNWKRGNAGDLSQDVVVYNFSEVANEVADHRALYGFDIIAGHCGPRPGPSWGDITNTRSGSARWTIDPYIANGWTP